MSDETITELARMLAEERRARRLAEDLAKDNDVSMASMALAAEEAARLVEDAKRAEHSRDEARAELAAVRAAMDEREGDIHMRIRREYDSTVVECWRLKVAEVQGKADAANEAHRVLEAMVADIRRELAEARAALDAAHEHDAAEVASLRALLREVFYGTGPGPWIDTPLWVRVRDAANGGGS